MKLAHVDARRTLEGLEHLHAGVLQAIGLTMRGAIAAAEGSAKGTDRFRDRSGKTRQSVKGEYRGLYQGGFVTAGGAAAFLENGTRAHEIHARSASALRFVVNGQTFFRRMVRHPGTVPRPFMAEAAQRGALAASYAAELYIGEAIRRAR